MGIPIWSLAAFRRFILVVCLLRLKQPGNLANPELPWQLRAV